MLPYGMQAKDEKPKGKDKEKEKEREKAKGESRDKGRSSKDDKGRSSKEEPPSKRTRSERDLNSKHKDDTSKKGDSKVAETGRSTRDSDRAKAKDSKKGVDKDAASAEKASKKRAHSEERKVDAKKPKVEKQPDSAKPPAAAKDDPAGEASRAEAAAAEKPSVAEAAAAQPAAIAAAVPPAAAALPPPVLRWPAQAMPFVLACRYFDRDLAGYIEAGDLEEILVMVSDNVSSKSPLGAELLGRSSLLWSASHALLSRWREHLRSLLQDAGIFMGLNLTGSVLDKEYACTGRRLQNLVDAVVKRSKLSYAEAYASLEVPVVPPPAQVPQSSAGVPPSGRAVNTGISSEQTSPRVRTPCL